MVRGLATAAITRVIPAARNTPIATCLLQLAFVAKLRPSRRKHYTLATTFWQKRTENLRGSYSALPRPALAGISTYAAQHHPQRGSRSATVPDRADHFSIDVATSNGGQFGRRR